MRYRLLGTTGLSVSEISFGAGPVSGLMTEGSFQDRQATLARALELGINWFDTAATYGAGQSELSLGKALTQLNALESVRIATKVRLRSEDPASLAEQVRESVAASLGRLGVERL